MLWSAMMDDLKWREDAEGALVAEAEFFRLSVCSVKNCHYVRFLVLARYGAAAGRLVGSGTAASVGQGMTAVQAMARRFRYGSGLADSSATTAGDGATGPAPATPTMSTR